jgi:predicted phosphodiesterase
MKEGIQIAVLSDIHGNPWALEEVLDDIKRRNVNQIVNLGDSLYGPLDPNGTAEILVGENILSICGNEDRIIIEDLSEENISPTLKFVRTSLYKNHLDWLLNLKPSLILFNEIYLCHGTPLRDNEYLLEKVTPDGVSLRDSDELSKMLSEINDKIILCGHSHVPNSILLPNGKIIVNPGSVGLPAYSDNHPFPHKMETGLSHARYSVLKKNNSQWQIENISISYDWQSASAMALKNGRSDWAKWLSTGYT